MLADYAGTGRCTGRVEALLLNILPEDIAQRLQAEPNAIADDFEDASILFADVVDFTPLASRLDARDVVGMLDRLFTAFDELVDHYEVDQDDRRLLQGRGGGSPAPT